MLSKVIHFVSRFSPLDSDIIERIFKGSFWVILGNVTSKIIVLISSVIVLRIIGEEQYGRFGLIRSTVNTFALMGSMGIGLASTKIIAEKAQDKKVIKAFIGNVLKVSCLLSMLVGSLVFIFSSAMATFIGQDDLILSFQFSSILIFAISIQGTLIGIMSGLERFKELSKGILIGSLIGLFLQVLGSMYYGVEGSVLGLMSQFVSSSLFFVFFLKKKYDFPFIKASIFELKKYSKDFMNISLPAALSGLLVSPIIWLSNTIVSGSVDGFRGMALVDISMQWHQLALFIPLSLSQIVLPILSANIEDKFTFRVSYRFNLGITLCISFLICVAISLLSSFILRYYGSSFLEYRLVFLLFLWSVLPLSYNNMIAKVMIAKSKVWYSLLSNILWGVFLIGSLMIAQGMSESFIYSYSFAFFLSYILQSFVQFIFYNRLE